MVSDELGTKRTCPSCGVRFYDLNKTPIICPKCAAAFVAEPLLPSKADGPVRSKPSKPAVAKDDEDEDIDIQKDATLVSLEDIEDDDIDDEDDEAAAIKDVDLGETEDDDDADDSDVFLDEDDDEEGGGVEGLIGGSKPGNDEV